MTMVTLRWEDAATASRTFFPSGGDDSGVLSRELSAAVKDAMGSGTVTVRLAVGAHAFFMLQGYAARLKDVSEFGRLDAAKHRIRRSLRQVGYNV